MTGERVPCPEGYEPVVDIVCGEPALYVNITNDPTVRLSDFSKLWPDGRPTRPWELLKCGSCGRGGLGESIEANGLRRDEHGVRRLW